MGKVKNYWFELLGVCVWKNGDDQRSYEGDWKFGFRDGVGKYSGSLKEDAEYGLWEKDSLVEEFIRQSSRNRTGRIEKSKQL